MNKLVLVLFLFSLFIIINGERVSAARLDAISSFNISIPGLLKGNMELDNMEFNNINVNTLLSVFFLITIGTAFLVTMADTVASRCTL